MPEVWFIDTGYDKAKLGPGVLKVELKAKMKKSSPLNATSSTASASLPLELGALTDAPSAPAMFQTPEGPAPPLSDTRTRSLARMESNPDSQSAFGHLAEQTAKAPYTW
eukprot:11924114-Prorocentrum_lima.AAC.1